MARLCFQMQVRPERIDEYRQRHAAVWPDMLRALKASGWHNYSLFLREDGLLIGYAESPSFADADAAMALSQVNARWQAEMSEMIDRDAALVGSPELVEVFNLENQLASICDGY
ncbi:L-rhamnose mutarotase [Microbacteriaceae bacterium VKM Ac-2854]|nr:L-rhamnose mutarotase [Microbacteriaceae bacterium VKM Ac-2854]